VLSSGAKAAKKQDDSTEDAVEEAPAEQKTSRAGRKTQPVSYKESGKGGGGQSVAVKEEMEVESEADAIKELAAGFGPFR